MATLMQAVERVRNDGQLPVTGSVSGRDLHNRFPPTERGSVRGIQLRMFQGATKAPWAVILCRFKGEQPDPQRETPIEQFYRGAFAPGTGGLVEYWRDVSLGKIDITGSRVFGWIEVERARSNANVGDPPGSVATRGTLVNDAIAAARRDGHDPITGFHSQLSVYIENWSMNGAPAGADWSHPTWGKYWIDGGATGGKVSLTPPHNGNIVAHEMAHGFGLDHDIGADLIAEYQDPCCIMSQNNALIHAPWNVPFGPALCLTHLTQKGWMYPRRLYVDNGGWMTESGGLSVPLASLDDPGARANLGIRLAFRRPGKAWDYFLEYVKPVGWNRGLGTPFVFVRRLAPSGSIETSAYLGSIQVPASMGPTAEFVEPSGNVRFTAQLFDERARILRVGATPI